MITDEHVKTFLVPREGLIHEIVYFTEAQTDAPLIYALASALTTVSALVNTETSMWGPGARRDRVNLYTLLVGDSSLDRKTTSMMTAMNILGEAVPDRWGKSPGSFQGLIDELGRGQHRVIPEPEFSRFLQQSRGDKLLSDVKKAYMDLYDCVSTTQSLANSREGNARSREVKDPRLSILAAIAHPLLSEGLEPSDMTGGFWARFFIAMGQRTRFLAPSEIEPDIPGRMRIAAYMAQMRDLAPKCWLKNDPQARKALDRFARELDKKALKLVRSNPPLAGTLGRAVTLTRKLAAIYALDRYIVEKMREKGLDPNEGELPIVDSFEASTNEAMETAQQEVDRGESFAKREIELWINLEDMTFAALTTKAHLKGAEHVLTLLAPTVAMRQRRRVLEILYDGLAHSIGSLIPELGVSLRTMQDILAAVKEEGFVIECTGTDGRRYYYRNDVELAEEGQPEGFQAILKGGADPFLTLDTTDPLPPPEPPVSEIPPTSPVFGPPEPTPPPEVYGDGYGDYTVDDMDDYVPEYDAMGRLIVH